MVTQRWLAGGTGGSAGWRGSLINFLWTMGSFAEGPRAVACLSFPGCCVRGLSARERHVFVVSTETTGGRTRPVRWNETSIHLMLLSHSKLLTPSARTPALLPQHQRPQPPETTLPFISTFAMPKPNAINNLIRRCSGSCQREPRWIEVVRQSSEAPDWGLNIANSIHWVVVFGSSQTLSSLRSASGTGGWRCFVGERVGAGE